MATKDKKLQVVDKSDFISNDFLKMIRSDDKMSSSMLDSIFIPSKKVPKKIIDKIRESDSTAEQIILQQMPLFEAMIEKPYWEHRLHIEIFGAVCLADDRHLLDSVLAHGNYLDQADKYTLRQVVEHGIDEIRDIDWNAYNNQTRIDESMSNKGHYFHISVVNLCRALNLKVQKNTRERLVERIRRLRNMDLRLTPEVKGELLANKANEYNLLGKDYHLLLDKAKMKGNDFNQDTFTDIIVNVDPLYIKSLEQDGYISRDRMINHYPSLVGKNNIEDFYKFLDSHQRTYIHKKYLSDLITEYLELKISIFSINKWYKIRQIYNQIIDDQSKLLKHFGVKLYKVDRDNFVNKDFDYQLIHLRTDGS
ncbi:MAG: hypothetical protein P8I03_02750 [Thalassotalea sp.]|nr:hypothetical protein [Thalassotalea sp.]